MDVEEIRNEWKKQTKYDTPDILLAKDKFNNVYLVMEILGDTILKVIKIPQEKIPTFKVYVIPLDYCSKHIKYYIIEDIDKLTITSCKTPFKGIETFALEIARKFHKKLIK